MKPRNVSISAAVVSKVNVTSLLEFSILTGNDVTSSAPRAISVALMVALFIVTICEIVIS